MTFTRDQKKMIALSSLGGALEFYDFVIFVFLAKLLGELFFPAHDAVASLMASLSVFAIGYLARPLGAILFGHFGDKFGRKKTFVMTVILMAVPTFLIGLLPTYQQIGIIAPILLVVLRLLQGLSLGGEIPGAVVFIAESAPLKHRGLATGLVLFGVNIGLLSGSLAAALLNHLLTPEQLTSWGWRLPFLIGGSLGVVSYYLRKSLRETPVFQLLEQQKSKVRFPFKEMVSQFPLPLLLGFAITALEAVIISIMILFLPTYLATYFHFSLDKLLTLNTISILFFAFPVLLMAYLSDRMGRKKIIIIGILFFCIAIYPLFLLFHHHDFILVIAVTSISSLFGSCIAGVFPCMTAELFPTQVRYSGMAVAYNLGFGIVGGLTPLLATMLIRWSGNLAAPSWILMVAAIFALIAWFFMRETHRIALAQER